MFRKEAVENHSKIDICTYIYTYIGGPHGVMLIIEGNGHGYASSNLRCRIDVMTLSNLMIASCDAGPLGNAQHPFIAIAPWSTVARRGSIW